MRFVYIAFWKWEWKSLSRVQLFGTPWTLQSMEFSRPEYWSGEPFPSPGDLPNPGIKPRPLTLQADSLPAEPQGKPKNAGVGSLSFLQGIFLTQELNRGHLHCRWILYQLRYQGSTWKVIFFIKYTLSKRSCPLCSLILFSTHSLKNIYYFKNTIAEFPIFNFKHV